MKKFIFLILTLLSLLAGIAVYFMFLSGNESQKTTQVMKAAPETIKPQPIKIVALGDSLTEGVGDISENGGYIPYLVSLLEDENNIKKAQIDNYGVKGFRSEQLVSKLQSDVEVRTAIQEADLVIVTIGGNDMMKVVRENITNLNMADFLNQRDLYKENLSVLLKVIRQENKHIHIVLVGLYNPFHQWFPEIEEMNEVVNEWNKHSQKILAQYPDTYFVDIMNLFKDDEEELLYTDYFHPNNRGYELIADKIYQVLHHAAIDDVMEKKWLVQKQEEL
ncbi:SGNH/GDSL hydrolase family protein [Bacillus tuaregi]|uniref:SGNH/GDSL hydrolase family protein n=1 Tax=Bacillus tuaregi TaxID=1816695 RepID=UPI0008F8E305|nr:SGNH/GDSL hydrolase family protein [Bacillus tuaregi]